MRSYWSNVGPQSCVTSVLVRRHRDTGARWPREDTDTQKEHLAKMGVEAGAMCPQARDRLGHWGRKRQEGFFSSGFRGSGALPSPWFQSSHLPNYDRMNLCCFKTPSGWPFATATPGNQYAFPHYRNLILTTAHVVSSALSHFSNWKGNWVPDAERPAQCHSGRARNPRRAARCRHLCF